MGKNKDYQVKANRIIAGGAHTYSRGDDQYPENAPPILSRGEGCHVWDMEGNEFLDYGMALRAVTVGYGYERIANAAIEQIRKGNNLTRASQIEVEAAEVMLELIDGMDMVKFAKNGSTVTTAATKLARAYTGKKYILRCAEHPFFSYDDWFIGNTVVRRGIPEEVQNLTLQFHFNDLDSAKEIFEDERYKNEIACVILEPATHIEPKEGFLQGLKSLCHKYGAVFILDEMITGFRWDIKGAQHYYKVVPDLCTFGKGMANGFSVAALMGKREIMELGGITQQNGERVFLASTTHGAEMSSLGALVETIKVYKELNVIKHLWNYGEKLWEGISGIANDLGIGEYFYLEGTYVSPNFVCKDLSGNVSMEYRTLFVQEMVKNKVLMPYISLGYAHGQMELGKTLEAAHKSLEIYKDALARGTGRYLEGKAMKPVFRAFN